MSNKQLLQGMTQVYTGDGKGKTTAALGVAMRAVGYGYKTFIIQFMKGSVKYGELESAKKFFPNIMIRQFGRECLVRQDTLDQEDIRLAQEAVLLAHKVLTGGQFDIVVLDEITIALAYGLISEAEVLQLMSERPAHVELIITGRKATPEIVKRADLVTEMVEVKHYYHTGVNARVGIEK
jgi:cob(I)alamin adenosyltransferase